MNFTITATDPKSNARSGMLTLPRGKVHTPVFMPVGTLATVKGITPKDLKKSGAEIILANTYHLMLRPGAELVEEFGGVSEFMSWHKPVLTDSGGYQVFSLAKMREISTDGVVFRSHIDGSKHTLTPNKAIKIQYQLNSDIMIALDVCPPLTASKSEVAASVSLTSDWAKQSQKAKIAFGQQKPESRTQGFINIQAQSLFPVIQGGIHLDLRSESVKKITEINAPGYAIGGVSVGETPEQMREVVAYTAPLLPVEKPRYLLGVGHPRDLLQGIAAGIDMFDCVLPTRNGRNGGALTSDGPLNLRNLCHRKNKKPISEDCDCYTCTNFSRGYLRHLFIAGEMLASQLTSMHNVRFLINLLERAREAIRQGNFTGFAAKTSERYLTGEKARKIKSIKTTAMCI